MPFIAPYDANALYPNAQRDLLIRIARHGLIQAKWTSEILDEMCGGATAEEPGPYPGQPGPAPGT